MCIMYMCMPCMHGWFQGCRDGCMYTYIKQCLIVCSDATGRVG